MHEHADILPLHLQKLVNAGVNGIDIMHGQLKLDLLEAENEYTEIAKEEEEDDYSDAMVSMERKYAEGFMDAITYMYKMTYDISFAISAKEAGE